MTLPDGYRVRAAREADLPGLGELERAAAARFRDLPVEASVLADVTPQDAFESAWREGRLLVAADADDRPVGFALWIPLADAAHLDEVDVHPEHGRRGLGAALVRGVQEAVRRRGLPFLTLTTFREVAWNAPFYRRLGFRSLPEEEWTPELRALVLDEDADGLRRADRVVMRIDTAG